VVARSQFRGTLKRRAYLASASAILQAGEEVFSANDPSQPSGVVAQACHHPVHGHWALVCLQNSALEEDGVAGTGALLTAAGAGLTLHPLPYVLRDDI
jgi:folate-binding Fe-S cluster repair protein YgfZ